MTGRLYGEGECLPLSALQHLLFCERQCALIHLEGLWAENALTVEGRHMHDKVDERDSVRLAAAVRVARGLPLRCLRLGLTGKADVVEFHAVPQEGAVLEGTPGLWRPFPVEYKRGKPKRERYDEVQLCAQAICLEEMLKTPVPEGALFYGQTRRRFGVAFDAGLRSETERTAERLHALLASGITPRAARQPKCDNCSLLEQCIPDNNAPGRSAVHYLGSILSEESPKA